LAWLKFKRWHNDVMNRFCCTLFMMQTVHYAGKYRKLTLDFWVTRYNRKPHGARSFCCAAPPLWNAFPHCQTLFSYRLQTQP
jgi:hypothetical protein